MCSCVVIMIHEGVRQWKLQQSKLLSFNFEQMWRRSFSYVIKACPNTSSAFSKQPATISHTHTHTPVISLLKHSAWEQTKQIGDEPVRDHVSLCEANLAQSLCLRVSTRPLTVQKKKHKKAASLTEPGKFLSPL